MNPSIKTTYLALTKSGHTVSSFGSPTLARKFAAERKAKGIIVELVEETCIRKPLRAEHSSEPVRLKSVGAR